MGLAVAFPYLSNPVNIYTGFTGAADLGVGANIVTDFVTGTHNFGLNLDFGWIYLDQGYVSGEQLDFTITVPDQTLASLGFTQGSFNINWASDSMQIETSPDPPPVPEPATMLLLGGGIAGLAGLRRRATTV
ncbi:MAG: PEP-CTERM sorting domain-containing protein, partial [Desulfuromonadales bacterium]|nr:PEP-CTERM sorting domain-containing protein [Desulfuromonadales bacterium]